MANEKEQRPVVIFGANGQLGSALARTIGAAESVSWTTARSWQAADIARWLAGLAERGGGDIVFASGITDPAFSVAELRRSNTEFPSAVLSAGARHASLRFMTIGSVMESHPEICRRNPYIASKQALSDLVAALAKTNMSGRVLHLRLHTLYGVGLPHAHMFLGQMFAAICAERPFAMTSGRQYRQYHHTVDIAEAMKRLLAMNWPQDAMMQLNSRETLQLRDIARSVFAHFARPDLLRLGALPEPAEDVSEKPLYLPSDPALFPEPRPALDAINIWLSDCYRSLATPGGALAPIELRQG
ncbi:MAG: NAD-dependent epimerase/dehydratase family protein [Proteobacteria bacterium]|nr:NAD-dependent epimerase/dehydratase family protein [Pseudomonadota bacterium]